MSKTSKRAISTLVIAILLISTIAAIIPMAAAAPLTGVTATPTPSLAGAEATFAIVFTTETAGEIATVDMAFPVGFDVSGATLVSTGLGAGIISVIDQIVTYTVDTPLLVPASTGITITLGTIVNTETPGSAYTVSVTTNLAGPVVLDGPTASGAFTIDESGTLSVTTTPIMGQVSIDVGAPVDTPWSGIVSVGAHTVDFEPVIGFTEPATQTPVVTADTTTDVLGTYVFIPQSGFTIDYVTPGGDVDYGKTLTVVGSGVTAGSEVIVYWDYATGTYIHPLNSTEGNRDGSFDLEVTVPSDVVGAHFLWIKNVATGEIISHGPITMASKIKLSPSSGLENDDITIKGYGFAEDSEIDIELGALSDDGGDDVEETDDLGYFEYTFEVNTDDPKKYPVTAEDEKGNDASANFKLGAAISIDIDEGPTGTVVTVEGRGWTYTKTITFREKTSHMLIEVVGDDEIEVGSNGQFSAEIVIPEFGSEGDYDIEAVELVNTVSSASFELTGLPEIVVTPTYGTPGKIITVKGYNFTQIAETEVTIKLGTEDLIIAETNSDGTFEDTFISPAVVFKTYDVEATDDYGLFAADPFKVGLIALIINPVYGEAGTSLFITGIGFADGDYNVTFGIKLYEEYGSGVDDEAISDYFFVPNVVPGPYDIIISDEDGNEMTVEIRVTAVTEVTLDPAMAPNEYNMTIEGCNFADYVDTVDFVLYNATDEWDMKVQQGKDPGASVKTCDDGNFTAWWEVLDKDTLSLGDYTINVTGYDDFFVQVPFSVVEARVDVAPRKALFDRGDSIQFNVKNDFTFTDAYMKIWDPDDNLYWQTDTFAEWLKVGDLYTVPYYTQTSGMNLMELSQDAPLGTWVYVFYEEGTTQLTNGTFAVGPSAESLLTEQITALSEELGVDIDTLRTYIDDLGIDMDEAVTMMAEEIASAVSGMEDDFDDAVTGMQDDISDLSDDIDGMGTKMDSIETMVDDISETSGDAQQAANDAKTSADQATEAALQNQRQTSGLTGLVYGAIGASLIAALAAIVSLMQISRRIAG